MEAKEEERVQEAVGLDKSHRNDHSFKNDCQE